MFIRAFIVIFLICFPYSFSNICFAQDETDKQLAIHYFQTGDFEKAVMYYEMLYDSDPSDFNYGYLYKCYVQLEQYDNAQKLVKRQQKKFKGNVKYLVDLGAIHIKLDEIDKANKLFQKAIDDVPQSQGSIVQLANTFKSESQLDFALKTYLHGKKLLKDRYPFNIEIAEIYGAQRKWEEMITEYLDLLEVQIAYLQTVQNAIGRTISFDKPTRQNNILKTELLKRIQRNPNNKTYNEMIIWVFVQLKDFEGAFLQIKAVDKKFKEDGGRLIALAQTCANNGNYDLAIKAYDYVIDEKGPRNYYYSTAKSGILTVMKSKITETDSYDQKDLISLENEYLNTLEQLGKTKNTFDLLISLAEIEAYYLNKLDTAISIIENTMNIPSLNPQNKAECKLLLGDFLIIKNEVWDALLLYAQVDKEFKYDQLGEIAKLKSAKTHYYTGNFQFAKGQLDVLKGSTSKLIANDAMELSRLITDNSTVDTTIQPMQMYSKADLLLTQQKFQHALQVLDSINLLYPGHALADEILYLKYKIALRQKQYKQAMEFLTTIVESYSYDILADNALYYLADMYQFRIGDKQKAMELYQKLLINYPGSLFVVEARKRFRELRGDEIN